MRKTLIVRLLKTHFFLLLQSTPWPPLYHHHPAYVAGIWLLIVTKTLRKSEVYKLGTLSGSGLSSSCQGRDEYVEYSCWKLGLYIWRWILYNWQVVGKVEHTRINFLRRLKTPPFCQTQVRKKIGCNISYHSSGEKEQPNSIITKGKMILPPFPKLQKVSIKKILSSFFLLPLNPIVVCVVP